MTSAAASSSFSSSSEAADVTSVGGEGSGGGETPTVGRSPSAAAVREPGSGERAAASTRSRSGDESSVAAAVLGERLPGDGSRFAGDGALSARSETASSGDWRSMEPRGLGSAVLCRSSSGEGSERLSTLKEKTHPNGSEVKWSFIWHHADTIIKHGYTT